MSNITLRSTRIPVIEIVNEKLPKDEQLAIMLKHGIKPADKPDEYVGMCHVELCPESEKEQSDKTFCVLMEIKGIFLDTSEAPNSEVRRNAVLQYLLPHINATLRAVMALARIPISFIPDSVFSDLINQ